jgi:hypothetical protein
MVASPIQTEPLRIVPSSPLTADNREHFLSEGFTPEEIDRLIDMGVKSISSAEALNQNFKIWNGQRWLTDAGTKMPFNNNYGQLRLNTPIKVPGRKKPVKYLTPYGSKCQLFSPRGASITTEGFKDAVLPTLRGVPTRAIPGVSQVIHLFKKGCGETLIFDSDAWTNPSVMGQLIKGAIWTSGKVQVFPQMPKYPHGGACEFFKCGYTIEDYKALISDAMDPVSLIESWAEKWSSFPDDVQSECLSTATKMVERLKDPDTYILKIEADKDGQHPTEE